MKSPRLACVLLLTSCAPNLTITVETDQPWVGPALDNAIAFWKDKDVEFVLGEGGIRLRTGPQKPPALGYWNDPMDMIVLHPGLDIYPELDQASVLAHELFHSLGAVHQAGGQQLMSEFLQSCPDQDARRLGEIVGKICWNRQNQLQLDRLRRERAF